MRPIWAARRTRAEAEVIVIAGDPDGLNINDGVGSTHLDVLRLSWSTQAHDGDATAVWPSPPRYDAM